MRSELRAKVPKFSHVKGRRSTGRWEILRYTHVFWLSKNVPSQTLLKNKVQVTYISSKPPPKKKHIFKMSSPHRSHDANPGTQWNGKTTFVQFSKIPKHRKKWIEMVYPVQMVLFKNGSFWKRYGYNNKFFGGGSYVCISMSIFAIPEEIWKSFFNKQPAPWVSSWTNEASKCPKRLHSDTVSVPKWR